MDGTHIIINFNNRICLIAGGGRGAKIKAKALKKGGARLRIIAPKISEELKAVADETDEREYIKGDSEGVFAVYALTDSDEQNRIIKEDARNSGALVGGEDFAIESSVRGENMSASVSTGYPKLSSMLMSEMMKYDKISGILKNFRADVLRRVTDRGQRAIILDAAVDKRLISRGLEDPQWYKGEIYRILVDNS